MDTIATGFEQSEIECLHREVLSREINASVSEAAPHFRRNEEVLSGSLFVTILGVRGSFNTYF